LNCWWKIIKKQAVSVGRRRNWMQVKEGDKVKVHYVGMLANGNVFDSSLDREPLEFKIGDQQVIPGFEQAVKGLEKGQKTTVCIPPEEAYGPYVSELVGTIERSRLPDSIKPELGMMLEVVSEDSQQVNHVTITAVDEDTVTLDGNHPLAGQELRFELELIDIVE
jgi:peptidylprolyl isomerase